MNKIRVYSDDEIKKLLSNSNVEEIKNKSQIVYKNSFKLWAVQEKLSHIEKTARQIFVTGGFDMNILDDRTPQRRLCSWVKKYQKFGEDYFTDKNKYTYQTKKKEITLSDAEKRFVRYIKKVIINPKFVAFIIDKDETGNFRIKNLVRAEDEKINR